MSECSDSSERSWRRGRNPLRFLVLSRSTGNEDCFCAVEELAQPQVVASTGMYWYGDWEVGRDWILGKEDEIILKNSRLRFILERKYFISEGSGGIYNVAACYLRQCCQGCLR